MAQLQWSRDPEIADSPRTLTLEAGQCCCSTFERSGSGANKEG